MERRLNIAAGLLHRPRLLVLDEPTAGVDPQSRNAILAQVETLGGEGVAVLYTTHYMEEAERLCDRVGIIDQGRLVAEGTRRELVATVGERDRIELTAPATWPANFSSPGTESRIQAPVRDLGHPRCLPSSWSPSDVAQSLARRGNGMLYGSMERQHSKAGTATADLCHPDSYHAIPRDGSPALFQSLACYVLPPVRRKTAESPRLRDGGSRL